MSLVSFIVGLALGAAHFLLFTSAMKKALSGDHGKGFLVMSVSYRLGLGLALILLWQVAGLAPGWLAGGVVAAWLLLKASLAARLR